MTFRPSLFRSFFLGGFECSSHRRHDGKRLDVIAGTAHDRFAASDYAQCQREKISTVRDGLRWHLIETAPGRYDWSSFLPMLRAARTTGTQVIWDLCHYGWPDDIDIWSPAFVDRFAAFCAATARVIREETDEVPFYCPVNEISFWSWSGGQMAHMNPMTQGRGGELKRQLVRAAIAGVEGVRSVDRRARVISAEPLIHVTAPGEDPARHAQAQHWCVAQFEATDMIAGRLEPELGGSPDHLDIVGVNFYPGNQWFDGESTIPMGHHNFRALRDLLADVRERYGRPLLIAETGAEGTARPAWLHYVCSEAQAAIENGVPLEGICLYPIVDYPGWVNERSCEVGLFSSANEQGQRMVCTPFLREFRRQQSLLNSVRPRPSRNLVAVDLAG